jgi:hypothetical protein
MFKSAILFLAALLCCSTFVHASASTDFPLYSQCVAVQARQNMENVSNVNHIYSTGSLSADAAYYAEHPQHFLSYYIQHYNDRKAINAVVVSSIENAPDVETKIRYDRLANMAGIATTNKEHTLDTEIFKEVKQMEYSILLSSCINRDFS